MSALVVSHIADVTISVGDDAVAKRGAAIDEAREITVVEDDFAQGLAVDALKQLNSLTKSVEQSRTQIKAPVLELGRKIDSTAKEFSTPMEIEIRRLNGLVTAYQSAQRKKSEEIERARQAELRRVEDERRKAEAAAEKAERERMAAQEQAEGSFIPDEASKAQEDAAKAAAQAEASRIEQERLKQEQIKLQSQVARTPEKVSGLVVKEVWKFEVIDFRQLAINHPGFVRMEVNASAVNEAIRGGMRDCSGIRIYSETQTQVRT